MRSNATDPAYHFVWKNIATPRVKFFGWLLTKNRINYKTICYIRKYWRKTSATFVAKVLRRRITLF
jgi:hypothetical protein